MQYQRNSTVFVSHRVQLIAELIKQSTTHYMADLGYMQPNTVNCQIGCYVDTQLTGRVQRPNIVARSRSSFPTFDPSDGMSYLKLIPSSPGIRKDSIVSQVIGVGKNYILIEYISQSRVPGRKHQRLPRALLFSVYPATSSSFSVWKSRRLKAGDTMAIFKFTFFWKTD